jgi:hypothetical protein
MTMARNIKWDVPDRTGVKHMCRIVPFRDLEPSRGHEAGEGFMRGTARVWPVREHGAHAGAGGQGMQG